MKQTFYDSPLGRLIIREEEGVITEIGFSEEGIVAEDTPLLSEAKKQLDEYFRKKRKVFDLLLQAEGTEFQSRVWEEMLKIPYGGTATYGEIAERIKSGCARSVGQACNRNPIAIVIPCHRVVGKAGKLVGYAGGLDKKDALLKLESDE